MRLFIRKINSLQTLGRRLTSFLVVFSFLISSGPIELLQAQETHLSPLKDEVLKQVDFSENLQGIINGHASTPLSLSENDIEALKLLGYSDDEIASLTIGDLGNRDEQQKLGQRVSTYANKKNSEIEQGVKEDVIPGLASAVIGMGFSALLGVMIGVKCRNQPSALVFAGTSAAWAALEMMIWKGYQINMKDINTIMNATEIPTKITKEVREIKRIISDIENDIKKSTAGTYDTILERNEDKLKKLKDKAKSLRNFLNRSKDSQFGAIRRIQESLELAAETSEKKSKNARIAAIGFTTAAGVATAESFKAFGDGGKCFKGKIGLHHKILNDVMSMIIPLAHAGFANVSDLDKIGIPLGAGLGAAYLHFEKSFADKIYNSAPSRAAIFLGMAGFAYFASVKLKKASEFLHKQAREMDIFATSVENGLSNMNAGFDSVQGLINEIKDGLLPAYEKLVENIKNSEEIQEALANLKDQASNVSTSVSTAEVEGLIKNELSENEAQIQSTIDEGKDEINAIDSSEYSLKGVSYLDFLDFLIPSAIASFGGLSIKPSCFKRGLRFPSMDEDCSCLSRNRCMSSRFPSQLKLKRKGAFVNLVTQSAFATTKANDLILTGKPKHALAIYKKLSSNTRKIEQNSLTLMNRKISKKYNSKSILNLTKLIRNSTKEGLKDYFSHSKRKPLSLATSGIRGTFNREQKGLGNYSNPVIERLKNDIKKAKKMGNTSLAKFDINSISPSSEENSESTYNYDQETIIRDPSVNIFMMISKRYMQVRARGRL